MSETIDTEVFEKQKSGGGCGKVLMWLFFIALLLSCLCCAGFICSGVHIFKSLKNGYIEDPVIAQQKTEEAFGEMNLPENIKPRAFLSVKIFGKDLGFASIYSWDVTGEAVPAKVIPAEVIVTPAEAATEEAAPTEETPAEASPAEEKAPEKTAPTTADEKGAIFFYALSDVLKGNEKEFVDAISQGLTQNKDKDYTVKRSEKASVKINGDDSDFTFSWMESKDKKTFTMVSGSFDSKKDEDCNVLIYLPGDIPQETVLKVLENIQK